MYLKIQDSWHSCRTYEYVLEVIKDCTLITKKDGELRNHVDEIKSKQCVLRCWSN